MEKSGNVDSYGEAVYPIVRDPSKAVLDLEKAYWISNSVTIKSWSGLKK